MPNISMSFHGREDIEFNDDIYNEKVFPTAGKYKFTITPQNSRFWRWGLRFSATPKANFSTENGRHNNPLTPDIHISVGQWENEYWTEPNNLELVQYHIPGFDHFLIQSKDYDGGDVYLEMIIFEESTNYNIVSMVMTTQNMKAGPVQIRIHKDLKYFTPFAWADKTMFDISVKIEFDDQRVTDNLFEFKPSAQRLADVLDKMPISHKDSTCYWILKLNPENFPIRSIETIDELYFGSYNSRFEKRPEYDLFQKIQVGDIVLGYAMTPFNEIVCVFIVENTLYSHAKHGEIIDLSILSPLDRNIPLHDFVHILTPEQRTQIDDQSKIRLIELTSVEFNSIRNAVPNNSINPQYFPSFHAEGNHRKVEDQLDFENDIKAIASLISLKELDPPLAIGLFGNWGAGKSFFMEKLSERVERICESNNEAYVSKAVQVRFNAWHYEDANLWASLMSEILESLNDFTKADSEKQKDIEQIYESLEVSSIQSTIIAEHKQKLEEKVIDWKSRRKKENDRLLKLSGLDLVKVILSDKKIRNDFNELNTQDLTETFHNLELINKYIDEAKTISNKFMFFFRKVGSLRGKRWTFLFISAIIVFLSALLVPRMPTVYEWWKTTWAQFAFGSATAISLFAYIKNGVMPFFETFKKVNERLQSLKKTALARQGQLTIDLTADEKELLQLENDLERINNQIKESEIVIESIVSGKALSKFIREQYANSSYAKQLGIVSAIRKDFCTLDHHLREQKKGQQIDTDKNGGKIEVQFKIDRIILYIDDLDRCSEQTVLKVLEAIHLMLAFPLFVVIVGVDPRWLNNAINKKLGQLLGGNEANNALSANSFATSYDYLEKIFQIPFAIKPIGESSREKLIDYLLKTTQSDKEGNTKAKPKQQLTEIHSPDANNESTLEDVNKKGNEQNKTPQNSDSTATNTSPANLEIKFNNSINTYVLEVELPLVFSEKEVDYIKKVSCLFGDSPRTINRYINIYRVIRIHKSWKTSYQFSDDHRATLILLAIIVGKPDKAKFLIDKIRSHSLPTEKLENIINNHTVDLSWLVEIITKNGLSDTVKLSIQTMQTNLELVARFSFRTL